MVKRCTGEEWEGIEEDQEGSCCDVVLLLSGDGSDTRLYAC